MKDHGRVAEIIPENKKENTSSRSRKIDISLLSGSPADSIMFLQRTIGNHAVERMISSGILQAKLRIGLPGDEYEQEADRVADEMMRMHETDITPRNGLHIQRSCPMCDEHELKRQPIKEEEEEKKLQSKTTSYHIPEIDPNIESHIQSLNGRGQPLSGKVRAFFEPRFGYDFSGVRVHTDAKAAESARAMNAKAYTVGQDVVFGEGQYTPEAREGKRLLAHELTHVMQQQQVEKTNSYNISRFVDSYYKNLPYKMIQRTPANKVSCGASTPLHVPATPPFDIADPVGVITDAESRANELLDGAIDELDYTRQQILAGSPIGWPTISDGLASAIQVMGLDPGSEKLWKGRGLNTAELLLRRLHLIRGTIGTGSFFFTCLGPTSGTIGSCSGSICQGADARSCGGSFRIVLCTGFWERDSENQGSEILHESAHNFADFIQDVGREGNAACYARFAEIVAGVDEAEQRTDLCPNP